MLRIGQGYDAHRFTEGGQLVLGGVAVEFEKSLAAHSDGDVALHALCDALLGAAAMGDIGRHFPDTDQSFKGIDSRILLRNVCAKLKAQGYAVGNVDVTIVAQRPKLAPYIDRMRATMQESFRGPVLGNVDWMGQVDYRYPGGAVATACSSSCTLQQAANNDVHWITQQVLQKLPPPASGQAVTITRATAPSQMHTVQLRWAEPDGDQTYDIEVYPM